MYNISCLPILYMTLDHADGPSKKGKTTGIGGREGGTKGRETNNKKNHREFNKMHGWFGNGKGARKQGGKKKGIKGGGRREE